MKKSLVIIFAVLILVVAAIWGMLYIRNEKVSTPHPARQEVRKEVTSTATKVTTSTLESSKVVNSTSSLSKGYVSLLGNITDISGNLFTVYSKGESLVVQFDSGCHVKKIDSNSQLQPATLQDIKKGNKVNIYCKVTQEGTLIASGITILSD